MLIIKQVKPVGVTAEVYLESVGDGINVCAVDKEGDAWQLLRLSAEGVLLFTHVDASLGMQLDERTETLKVSMEDVP